MPIVLSIVASLVRETNGILKLIDPDIPCGKSQSKQEVGSLGCGKRETAKRKEARMAKKKGPALKDQKEKKFPDAKYPAKKGKK